MIDVKIFTKPKGAISGTFIGGGGQNNYALEADVREAKESIFNLTNFNLGLANLLVPCDEEGNELPGGWEEAAQSDGEGGIKAKSLKAKVSFFSVGDVAALGHSGIGEGDDPVGGASRLADLTDVALTNLTKGQSLVFDGAKWVNQLIESGSGGIDEAFLAQWLVDNGYLTSAALSGYLTRTAADGLYQPKGNYLTASALNGYATESWVNSQGFLKSITKAQVEAVLTGSITSHTHSQYLTAHQSLANYVTLDTAQTISGAKTFTANRTEFTNRVQINGVANEYAAYPELVWHIPNTEWTKIKMHSSGALHVLKGGDNNWTQYASIKAASFIRHNGTASQFLKADGSVDGNSYALSTSLASYVKKSGDTMTGALNFGNGNCNIHNTNDYVVMAAVDGLDRVVVSGTELRRSAQTPVYALGSADYRWSNVYANTINVTSNALVSNLNADMLDGLHSSDFPRLWRTATKMWDDGETVEGWSRRIASTPGLLMPYGWGWAQSTLLKLGSYTIDSQKYTALDIRNGDLNYEWQQKAYLFLPAHEESTDIFIAQMTRSSGTNIATKVRRYADFDTVLASNVASATKLQTARKLWGQYFDGTGNVDGAFTQNCPDSGFTNNAFFGSSALADGHTCNITFGKSTTPRNMGYIGHRHVADGSDKNSIIFGGHSKDYLMMIRYDGNVGIGTMTPEYMLSVNGTGWYSGELTLYDKLKFYSYHTDMLNCIRGGNSDFGGIWWDDNKPEKCTANLEICSHWGIVFKTTCEGQTRSGKIAVGINTREGELHAFGDIRSWTKLSVRYGELKYDDAAGAIYTEQGFYSKKNIEAYGDIVASNLVTSSDMRLKDIVNYTELTIAEIAKAPLFTHTWKGNNDREYIGTSAQYWLERLPQVVSTRRDGYYALAYDKLAVSGVISIARAHLDHETRIERLERENRALKEEVNTLRNKMTA